MLSSLTCLSPSSCQFVEELVIEGLVSVLCSHGEEDVASDKLVYNLEGLTDKSLVVLTDNGREGVWRVDSPLKYS